MEWQEITVHTLKHSILDDNPKLSQEAAEWLFKFLNSIGALKGHRFQYNAALGQVLIVEDFTYFSAVIPHEGDTGERTSQRIHTVKSFLTKLARFDRAQRNRMRNVEAQIARMRSKGEKLAAELFGRA